MSTVTSEQCVQCGGVLMKRTRPEPHPSRPHDQLVTYICAGCAYELRVHRHVNAPSISQTAPRTGDSGGTRAPSGNHPSGLGAQRRHQVATSAPLET
jgi:hypothetical protein